MWKEGNKKGSHAKEEWESMVPHPSFEKFMRLYRFKEFRLLMLQKHYGKQMIHGGSLGRL